MSKKSCFKLILGIEVLNSILHNIEIITINIIIEPPYIISNHRLTNSHPNKNIIKLKLTIIIKKLRIYTIKDVDEYIKINKLKIIPTFIKTLKFCIIKFIIKYYL